MSGSSWIREHGVTAVSYIGVTAAIALSYMGIRALERYDPMSHYSQQYADAGMNNAVLTCDQATVRSRKLMQVDWQFSAASIRMDRDFGSWTVSKLHDGYIRLPGNKQLKLKFRADSALYNRFQREMQMQQVSLSQSTGTLISPVANYNELYGRLELPKGCKGRYENTDVDFKHVVFNLNTMNTTVKDGRIMMLAQASPNLAVANTKTKKSRYVTVSFKSFEELQGKTRKGLGLSVVDGDTKFVADQAVQDIATNTVQATGHLQMDDVKYSATGDKAFIEIKPRHAVITGHVVINTKPTAADASPTQAAPASEGSSTGDKSMSIASEREKPAVITCDKADVLYGTKIVTLTGNLKIVQKITEGTRTLTADRAVYDVNAEEMELVGNVHAVDEKGQELHVPSMTLGLKKGNEWIKATQGGTMVIIEEDDN